MLLGYVPVVLGLHHSQDITEQTTTRDTESGKVSGLLCVADRELGGCLERETPVENQAR